MTSPHTSGASQETAGPASGPGTPEPKYTVEKWSDFWQRHEDCRLSGRLLESVHSSSQYEPESGLKDFVCDACGANVVVKGPPLRRS